MVRLKSKFTIRALNSFKLAALASSSLLLACSETGNSIKQEKFISDINSLSEKYYQLTIRDEFGISTQEKMGLSKKPWGGVYTSHLPSRTIISTNIPEATCFHIAKLSPNYECQKNTVVFKIT